MQINSFEVLQTTIQERMVVVQKCNTILYTYTVSLSTAWMSLRSMFHLLSVQFTNALFLIKCNHFFLVGSKNGANSGSDASPPLQSYTEESSPENLTGSTPPLGMGRVRNCHSTESLDSLSDESGGHSHNKTSSSTSSRKVIRKYVKHSNSV